MARIPGSLLEHISDRVKEDIVNGPILEIRESFALRAAVEKDIMKVQDI